VPDDWLEVSNRKVLRPAISTQVFFGFPGSWSKCWDGSRYFLFQFATTCFPCSPLLTKSRVSNVIVRVYAITPLPPGFYPFAVNNNNNNNYYYYYYILQYWYFPSDTTSTIFWCFYCISSYMFRPLIWPSSGYLRGYVFSILHHYTHNTLISTIQLGLP
jgi:hypothetical protein